MVCNAHLPPLCNVSVCFVYRQPPSTFYARNLIGNSLHRWFFSMAFAVRCGFGWKHPQGFQTTAVLLRNIDISKKPIQKNSNIESNFGQRSHIVFTSQVLLCCLLDRGSAGVHVRICQKVSVRGKRGAKNVRTRAAEYIRWKKRTEGEQVTRVKSNHLRATKAAMLRIR